MGDLKNSQLKILDFQVGLGHVIHATIAVSSGNALTYSAESSNGESKSVDVVLEERHPSEGINLAAIQDAPEKWNVPDAFPGLAVEERGQDWEWTLENSRMAFIRTTSEFDDEFGDVTAFLVFPEGEPALPVEPNQHFQLQVLCAVHRCVGKVVVDVLDQDGDILETHLREVDPKKRGGKKEADHQRIFLSVQTPARAKALRIGVQKSKAQRGNDSFLFVSRPSLVRVPPACRLRST